MESWLLGWLIGSIAVLLIQYFVAREFQRIAEMKGHHEKRYFWITFFLWIVGMLLVIALPDLKNCFREDRVKAVMLHFRKSDTMTKH